MNNGIAIWIKNTLKTNLLFQGVYKRLPFQILLKEYFFKQSET